jgi:hypothetical protein
MVALLMAGVITSVEVTRAQALEPPPLPIIFEGTVRLDNQLVAEGWLTLYVSDWRSARVPVVDGAFRCGDPCLLAGPTSTDYLGKLVTFHLDDRFVADVTFPFPNLAEPAWQEIDLSFSSAGMTNESPDKNSNVGLIALLGFGAFVLVAGGTVFMTQRGRESH